MLERGAEVNYQVDAGTALIFAAMFGHSDAVKLLLQAGADINIQEKAGFTALMFAAGGGHEAVVELLLEAGVQVNMQDEDGFTSLMHDAQGGHANTVKLLLEHPESKDKIDTTIRNKEGKDVFSVAQSSAVQRLLVPSHYRTIANMAVLGALGFSCYKMFGSTILPMMKTGASWLSGNITALTARV